MTFRSFLALGLCVLMSSAAMAREYVQGQVWSYHSRPGEETSTLLINLVEEVPGHGKVFHISVRAVHVKSPHHPDGEVTDLPHFPVSARTLESSCVELIEDSDPNPEYLEGYRTWRAAFDAGEAGVFNIPVAEIVSLIESTVAGQ